MNDKIKEIKNNLSEVNNKTNPRNIIKSVFDTDATKGTSNYNISSETNKMRAMEEYGMKQLLDLVKSNNSRILHNENYMDNRDQHLFSKQELEFARKNGVDLYKFVKDTQEVTVNMMQFSEQDSNQYKIYDTETNSHYSYTICGNGHSLMRYAYTSNSTFKIYFSDYEAEPQFPIGTGENQYAIIYRSSENKSRGFRLELPDLGPDALSDNDNRILIKVLDVANKNTKYDKVIMTNNISRYPNSDTSKEYTHILKALDTFELFQIMNESLNKSSPTSVYKWVEAAKDSISIYNEIKHRYNSTDDNSRRYNKYVKDRVNMIDLLDNQDRNSV